MKKILSLFFVVITISASAQKNKPFSKTQIEIQLRVIGFLEWYKNWEHDSTKHNYYRLIKGGYPDTTTKARIDEQGVGNYLQYFTNSGYVSDTYVHSLHNYFSYVDDMLEKRNVRGLVKIAGMDIDFVLQTFEPEEIFNHLKNTSVNKCYVIYNKAIISIHFAPHIDMLFMLTNTDKQWLIDYVGADADDPLSFFRQ